MGISLNCIAHFYPCGIKLLTFSFQLRVVVILNKLSDSQIGVILLPRGCLVIPETCLVGITWKSVAGIPWVEAKNAPCPTVHWVVVPAAEHFLIPNVISTKVESSVKFITTGKQDVKRRSKTTGQLQICGDYFFLKPTFYQPVD